MGFCEMIYHETRSFPAEEKEGLARELRLTSMKLLRVLTIESVKPPKEFLKALDDTVPIQLDILLLLKLGFRLTYINKRAYQTLEEDLKGLELIANNMRNMHGLSPAKWSIHEKVHAQAEPQAFEKAPPQLESKPPQKIEKPQRPDKDYRPHGKEHRYGKPPVPRREPQPPVSHSVDKGAPKAPPPTKTPVQVQKPTQPESSAVKPSAQKEFEGTPLFEEEMPSQKSQETKPTSVLAPEKKVEKESADVKSTQEQKPSGKAEHKKARGKGLWSLRRNAPQQTEKKNPSQGEGFKK